MILKRRHRLPSNSLPTSRRKSTTIKRRKIKIWLILRLMTKTHQLLPSQRIRHQARLKPLKMCQKAMHKMASPELKHPTSSRWQPASRKRKRTPSRAKLIKIPRYRRHCQLIQIRNGRMKVLKKSKSPLVNQRQLVVRLILINQINSLQTPHNRKELWEVNNQTRLQQMRPTWRKCMLL